jgi:hypothetical protein
MMLRQKTCNVISLMNILGLVFTDSMNGLIPFQCFVVFLKEKNTKILLHQSGGALKSFMTMSRQKHGRLEIQTMLYLKTCFLLCLIDSKPNFTVQLEVSNGLMSVKQIVGLSNTELTPEQQELYTTAFGMALQARESELVSA